MTRQSGSALLMVLWLSAALSAIAFTVANTVRSETERTSTEVDSLRCYYLATGAIERALVYVQWGDRYYTAPPRDGTWQRGHHVLEAASPALAPSTSARP